jgi:hypothetical protein
VCEGGQGRAEISRTVWATGGEPALDLAVVEPAKDLGSVAAPLELLGREHTGKVDERPGDARDRQAVGLAYDIIETIKGLASVYTELRRGRTTAQGRHVELPRRQRPQLPSCGGRAVTQGGGINAATRQHRRPHPSALRHTRMADRVHAAVNPMQPSVPDPPLNRALRHAGSAQLRG